MALREGGNRSKLARVKVCGAAMGRWRWALFRLPPKGRILGRLAQRVFEEGDMETDGRAGTRSRISTRRRRSTTLGMRAPSVQSGHARSHTIGLRVADSEDGALKGKGGLR